MRALASSTLALLLATNSVAADLPDFSWLPSAPRLPPASGQVIRVTNVDELFQAANDIRPGGTILIADGHYMMPRYFDLHTDNVTLRGASGRRGRVILDGAKSRHGELVGITGCAGVESGQGNTVCAYQSKPYPLLQNGQEALLQSR